MLDGLGLSVPRSKVVTEAGEGAAAADEIGFPVVVKALGVAHKTEVGGVALGLQNGEDVRAAIAGMAGLSGRFLVESVILGVVAELIVGVARDSQFGPHLVVGGGGTVVELMKDRASLLFPVTRDDVLEAIEGLRCAPLLRGFRGRPIADRDAAVDAVMTIARWVEENPDAVAELDINPLLVRVDGHGVMVADALIGLTAAGAARWCE